MSEDKILSLFVDAPEWEEDIQVDDFIVAMGAKKTNSVYHVVEARTKPHSKPRMKRNLLKCYRSDLITALRRDPEQKLIPFAWYNRRRGKGNTSKTPKK